MMTNRNKHDDRTGVDDHLDDGDEVRAEGDELDRHAEQRQHQPERSVHRIAQRDDADGSAEDHHRSGEEHHVFEKRGVGHRPTTFTTEMLVRSLRSLTVRPPKCW